jgi:hypothetical protein
MIRRTSETARELDETDYGQTDIPPRNFLSYPGWAYHHLDECWFKTTQLVEPHWCRQFLSRPILYQYGPMANW